MLVEAPLDIENFDPRANHLADEGIAAPFTKLEVMVVPNSSHLSPEAFYQAQLQGEAQQYDTSTPGSIVISNTQVAGQTALQVYVHNYDSSVARISYIVPDPKIGVMILITQYAVTSPDPSPVLAHAIASLTLGG